MHLFLASTAAVWLLLAGAHPAPPPSPCQLTRPVAASAAPRGKGKRTRLTKGAVVELGAEDGPFIEVRQAGGGTLYAKTALLRKACRAAPAAEGALMAAAPAAEVEAAPEASAETPEPTAAVAEDGASAPAAVVVTVAPASPGGVAESAPGGAAAREPAAPAAAAAQEPAPASSAGKITIAVMDLRGAEKLPPEIVSSLAGVIPSELDALGPFKSISSQDIQQMLALETIKQQLGCSDVACLAEIGGAIGAAYMISVSLVPVDTTYMIQGQLVNIGESRVEKRISRDFSGAVKGLFDELRTTTKLLVRDLLAARSGSLRVAASEEGATIKVDGTIVGVSPMEPLRAAGGMHTVSVEKTGFVVWANDVEVEAAKEIAVRAVLLPSEEFKRAYTAHASLVRTLAWVFGATGVAAGAAGAILLLATRDEANAVAADIATYNADPTSWTDAAFAQLDGRRRAVATEELLSLVGWGVGAAALATGVALFFAGDDPGRFDVQLEVAPVAGGAQAGLRLALP